MTRDVTITGGVSVVGSIEVYEDDGVTVLTSIDFPNFTGGTPTDYERIFFINNTGNQPVYVCWNISDSSIPWDLDIMSWGYTHTPIDVDKYHFHITDDTYTVWSVNSAYKYIPVDQGRWFTLHLDYTGDVNIAETFSFTVSFYAEDA